MKQRAKRCVIWPAGEEMRSIFLFLFALLLGAQQTAVSDGLAESRCIVIGESPDLRVSPSPQIAPGAPPLLSFRYYEGAEHHRFGNQDLMLDDAGH